MVESGGLRRLRLYIHVEQGWYPGQSVEVFGRNTRDVELVDSPLDSDVIWYYSYYLDPGEMASPAERLAHRLTGRKAKVRRRRLRGVPIVGSFHHLTPWKRGEWGPHIRWMDQFVDIVHCFSERNRVENRSEFTRPIFVAPYWIDLDAFRPRGGDERREIRQRFGLPPDKVIIGSFQRDTEADLETPKKEKGPELLADIIGTLDRRRIFVLLAGPRRDYLHKRLAQMGIAFKSLGDMPYAAMPDLYAAVDRYVVTSRVEGGPQAILECMAVGTPIHSTNVGISDVLSPRVVHQSAEDYSRALADRYPNVLETHRHRVQDYDAARVVPMYEGIFRSIVSSFGRRRLDMSVLSERLPTLSVEPGSGIGDSD